METLNTVAIGLEDYNKLRDEVASLKLRNKELSDTILTNKHNHITELAKKDEEYQKLKNEKRVIIESYPDSGYLRLKNNVITTDYGIPKVEYKNFDDVKKDLLKSIESEYKKKNSDLEETIEKLNEKLLDSDKVHKKYTDELTKKHEEALEEENTKYEYLKGQLEALKDDKVFETVSENNERIAKKYAEYVEYVTKYNKLPWYKRLKLGKKMDELGTSLKLDIETIKNSIHEDLNNTGRAWRSLLEKANIRDYGRSYCIGRDSSFYSW